MNALVDTPTTSELQVLDLLVRRRECRRVKRVAEFFRYSEAHASSCVSALRARGWVAGGRGCCEPTEAGRRFWQAYEGAAAPANPDLDALFARAKFPALLAAHAPASTEQPPQPRDAPPATSLVQVAMEPRGSIDRAEEASLTRLVDALASFQDPLLVQANAQLRLRVTELEAEVAALRASRVRTLELLAAAADAVTG